MCYKINYNVKHTDTEALLVTVIIIVIKVMIAVMLHDFRVRKRCDAVNAFIAIYYDTIILGVMSGYIASSSFHEI